MSCHNPTQTHTQTHIHANTQNHTHPHIHIHKYIHRQIKLRYGVQLYSSYYLQFCREKKTQRPEPKEKKKHVKEESMLFCVDNITENSSFRRLNIGQSVVQLLL